VRELEGIQYKPKNLGYRPANKSDLGAPEDTQKGSWRSPHNNIVGKTWDSVADEHAAPLQNGN
jgi:hypothetical protein